MEITTKKRKEFPVLDASSDEPATISGVRQAALEHFSGSLALVTAIANGVCHIQLRERCPNCGHEPSGEELSPRQLMKLVPKPGEITQANALLAKVSLPTQLEGMLSLAEGRAMFEAWVRPFVTRATAFGVPECEVKAWYAEACEALTPG
jgi:hypothetical protein